MTDREIVKALEDLVKCNNNEIDCDNCSLSVFYPRCPEEIGELSLDLINRLQAENERLKTENKLLIDNDVRNKYPNCVLVEKGRIYTRTLEDYENLIGDISAEAYKEFDELLKDECLSYPLKKDDTTMLVDVERYNNLLKELVGEDK